MKHFILSLAFILLCFAGCAKSTTLVTGTVKFDDGKPADFGAVIFQSELNNFTAKINSDGTYKTTGDIYNGLPAGNYKVFISGAQEKTVGASRQVTVTYRCAKKFCSAATSDLTFEVKPGGAKTYDIVLEKEKP
jgi:hypothetical protein